MTRHVTPYAGTGQNPEAIRVHVDLADRAEVEK